MTARRKSILGVEIANDEVRIVALRDDGGLMAPCSAGRRAFPPGAVEDGIIKDTQAIGETISLLLVSMNEPCRDACFSIVPERVTTRVIEAPPAPEDELRSILDGELHHFGVLSQDSGAFCYRQVRRAQGSDLLLHVLVFAVDRSSLEGIKAVARQARLRPVAIEPAQSALWRAAATASDKPQQALVLMSENRTDVVVVDTGELLLYRSTDNGAHSLVPLTSKPVENAPLNPQYADAIAAEVSRSIEYCRREFPERQFGGAITFATNCPTAAPFGEYLQNNLDLPVATAAAPASGAHDNALAQVLGLPDGHRYTVAYGLALGQSPSGAAQPGELDLDYGEIVTADLALARNRATISLIASIAIVATTIGGMWFFGTRANGQEHRLGHLRDELAQLKAIEQRESQSRLKALDELRRLAPNGVPVAPLLDAVAARLDPGSGLSGIDVANDKSVKIAGEAASRESMLGTLDALRLCPALDNVSLDSFASMDGQNRAGAVRFEVTASCNGSGLLTKDGKAQEVTRG